jgi:porphobilinogen synthase
VPPSSIRPRRLRVSPGVRALVRETRLAPSDFVLPLFAVPGENVRREVPSMPGVHQTSVDELLRDAEEAAALGLGGVLLFGIPPEKDAAGSGAYAADGIVQAATRAVKAAFPDVPVITDVCLCEYTDHGHCGVLDAHTHAVRNDETLPLIAQTAVSHADAGADVVAPSGMMDGAVAALRAALDAAGHVHVPVLSYAVKYASACYGPFRDAAEGAPAFGDRRSHQMDPANAAEALREADLDVAEGADLLMVKPALAYLDVIRRVKDRHPALPLVAYNVSGEYAMVKAAAAKGWLDERAIALEILLGIRRAGADRIITYHARDAARWLA